jgi:hypothetical protein
MRASVLLATFLCIVESHETDFDEITRNPIYDAPATRSQPNQLRGHIHMLLLKLHEWKSHRGAEQSRYFIGINDSESTVGERFV